MKTAAIIQARMGSTRLPGKVMRPLAGRPVLARVIERVRACSLVDEVVVATTTLPRDDVIVEAAASLGVRTHRGSDDDVLSRVYQAARGAEVVVRVTADCPLFDPGLLEQMLIRFHEGRTAAAGIDCLSNTIVRTYPRGLDAEIVTFDALERACEQAVDPYEREHVTPYIYRHPELFRIEAFTGERDLSHLRWTLDTEEDYRFLTEVHAALAASNAVFPMQAVLDLLARRPDLVHTEERAASGHSGAVT
ncbi:MAG: cytidylyltransferase domain-containing protein [bacterium]